MALLLSACSSDNWRSASRASARLAPDPLTTPEPVIQVYGADAWGWRGWFAIHTWIAVKPENALDYTVYEVVGWRERRGLPVLRIEQDVPDRYWYGAKPQLILDRRGDGVGELIDKIATKADEYPWKDSYRVFPGPNSNTFPAWIAQEVPELELELPFSAIGSGWAD
ncbi:DUF3750 domain-containing protein [Hahella sp. CCB-MM4]|uniref:DUF3750 domain-containing protein n=1 Tax=Hahella sp. (strain CCB-MM4) TaxID=1926491 RepID=UPI001FEE8108|nr:DUF3750 domain-containing protein [Hahella sp. CCB-MM4]